MFPSYVQDLSTGKCHYCITCLRQLGRSSALHNSILSITNAIPDGQVFSSSLPGAIRARHRGQNQGCRLESQRYRRYNSRLMRETQCQPSISSTNNTELTLDSFSKPANPVINDPRNHFAASKVDICQRRQERALVREEQVIRRGLSRILSIIVTSGA